MKMKKFIILTDARTGLPIAICGDAVIGMTAISKQEYINILYLTEEEAASVPNKVVTIDCYDGNGYTVSEPVTEITEKLENLDWD